MKTRQNIHNCQHHWINILVLMFTGLFMGGFASYPLQAQITFGEEAPPFGMSITLTESNLAFHALVDIDNDGDLDNFVCERDFVNPCWIVSSFEFYENTGTPECPVFELVEDETFGLPELTPVITFADMDADGDPDAFIGNHCFSSSITYHENTGSANVPQFSETPTQTLNVAPWGIGFAMLAIGDLDGDGDFDALVNGYRPAVFRYLENIGTPESFDFAAPVSNPFGLSIPLSNSSEWSQFVDMDCDGDLDILNAHWLQGGTHNNWRLYFHENIGTSTAPAFANGISTERLLIPMALGDMDGDGDPDMFSDSYYYENTSITDCISLPTASFSMMQNGSTIEFTNNSNWQETACNPVEFEWDFGDGNTSDEENPVHTFTASGEFSVCLTVKDIAGDAQSCATIVDVKETRGKGFFAVFPNPASGQLTAQWSEEVSFKPFSIEVVTALGQVVSTQSVHPIATGNGRLQLNLNELSPGVYFLRIQQNGMTYQQVFIKE